MSVSVNNLVEAVASVEAAGTFISRDGFAAIANPAPGTYLLTLNSPVDVDQMLISATSRGGYACGGQYVSPTQIRVLTADSTGFVNAPFDVMVLRNPLATDIVPPPDPLAIWGGGGGGGVPIMTSILWVNPTAIGSTEDGSLSNPYLTISAAITALNAIPTPTLATDPVLRTIYVVAICPGWYDEQPPDIDGTCKHIMLWGFGPWGLGQFNGPQLDPTGVPRNLRHFVTASNIDNIRHSFGVGTFGPWPGEGLTTHPSYNTGARISGRIIMDDLLLGGTTVELYVAAQIYDAGGSGFSIEAAQGTPAPGVLQAYLYRSRFASVVGGGLAKRMRLQVADRCRFDGLIDINRYSFVNRSQIAAGMTVVSGSSDIQPSGMLECNFAGTFTGPAASARIDGNTNYWMKTNGALLAGGATKVIQDDLVP